MSGHTTRRIIDLEAEVANLRNKLAGALTLLDDAKRYGVITTRGYEIIREFLEKDR